MDVRRLHAAVLRLQGVVGRLRNAELSAHVLDLPAAFDLLQRRDDLAFVEFALANRGSPWGYFSRRPRFMSGVSLRGGDTTSTSVSPFRVMTRVASVIVIFCPAGPTHRRASFGFDA